MDDESSLNLHNKTSTKSDEWQMTAGNILKGHDVWKGHLERARHNSYDG